MYHGSWTDGSPREAQAELAAETAARRDAEQELERLRAAQTSAAAAHEALKEQLATEVQPRSFRGGTREKRA